MREHHKKCDGGRKLIIFEFFCKFVTNNDNGEFLIKLQITLPETIEQELH